jgi:hypothetical protein
MSRRPTFSLGFRNLLGDIAWLEAVQVMGTRRMTAQDYDRLHELINITANFDPKFKVPFLLGGLVLGESPLHAKKALQVLERGKSNHPSDWRLPFYEGFTHYFSLGDAEAGGAAMGEAARLPGAPSYLPGLASRMLTEARKPEEALFLLETIVRQESDPQRREVLERRMREVAAERDVLMLEEAVERYRERKGTFPASLRELVRDGFLAAIPQEPNGGRYLLGPGGKVRSDRTSMPAGVHRR